MCELLGICYRYPILASVSLRCFAMRDDENADGWGLAWYRGRSLAVAKEPITWRSSAYSTFLEEYPSLRSHLVIGHVRKATVGGEPNRADTHPFSRELWGREFCFAHNGTLRNAAARMPLGRFTPIGDTDSEHAFCHLLASVEANGTALGGRTAWRWLHEQCSGLNQHGRFNCLLADGERLLAYHDRDGFKGLYLCSTWLHRGMHGELDDATVHVDIEADGDELHQNNRGVVIATAPLNDEDDWHRIEPGELIVLQRGRVVYRSSRAELAVRPEDEQASPGP